MNYANHNTCHNIKLRYDTIEEFNMDSKAECGQLNLAHITRNKDIHNTRSQAVARIADRTASQSQQTI